MAIAYKKAQELVTEGEFFSAVLGDEAGEASCLTVTVLGDPHPFYIQPDYPERDELEEGPCIPLYVEREPLEVPDWEPIPVAISLDSEADIEEGVSEVFDHILSTINRSSNLTNPDEQ